MSGVQWSISDKRMRTRSLLSSVLINQLTKTKGTLKIETKDCHEIEHVIRCAHGTL